MVWFSAPRAARNAPTTSTASPAQPITAAGDTGPCRTPELTTRTVYAGVPTAPVLPSGPRMSQAADPRQPAESGPGAVYSGSEPVGASSPREPPAASPRPKASSAERHPPP